MLLEWQVWATFPVEIMKVPLLQFLDDGSVVVGSSSSASGYEAFRWTKATGMVGLGDLPGGEFRSDANSLSIDGSVVVGVGSSTSGPEVFRWTDATGMVGLGLHGLAVANSADGKVILAIASNGSNKSVVIWDIESCV